MEGKEDTIYLPACCPKSAFRGRELRMTRTSHARGRGQGHKAKVPSSRTLECRPFTAPSTKQQFTPLFRPSTGKEDYCFPHLKDLELPATVRNAWDKEIKDGEELRIMLIGKPRSGKSSVGNTILGEKVFDKSDSQKVRYGRCERFDRKILVVDTPDIFAENTSKELSKCYGLTSPGPHAVVFVVGIGMIDGDDEEVYRKFIDLMGNFKSHVIMLFCRKDSLVYEGMTIFGYVNEIPVGLQRILNRCSRRYVAFDNTATGREAEVQVRKLLDLTDNIIILNKSNYSNETFSMIETALNRRVSTIKAEMEEKCKEEMKLLVYSQKEDECGAQSLLAEANISLFNTEPKSGSVHKFAESMPKVETNSGSKLKDQRKKAQKWRQRRRTTQTSSPIISHEHREKDEVLTSENNYPEKRDLLVKVSQMKRDFELESDKDKIREKVRQELMQESSDVSRIIWKLV